MTEVKIQSVSKKTLLFSIIGIIIFFGSLFLNGYVFLQVMLTNARTEGASLAVQNMAAMAQKDGKLVFNGEQNGKPVTLTLVIQPTQETKK
jgi:hypothetical protein